MKKMTVVVTRADEYEISIDESVWNEAALVEWSSVFSQVDSVEDLAKIIAGTLLHQGTGEFYEGFGYIKQLYANGNMKQQWKDFNLLKEKDYCKGITVTIITHDDDYEYEVEIKD